MKPLGQYITVGTAARRLGWTDYAVLRAALDRRLRVRRVGGRRLVRAADVQRILDGRR